MVFQLLYNLFFCFQPPIMPAVSYEGDTSNFDEYPETDWKSVRSLDSDELKLFANF